MVLGGEREREEEEEEEEEQNSDSLKSKEHVLPKLKGTMQWSWWHKFIPYLYIPLQSVHIGK
jgi:hypothetical protein